MALLLTLWTHWPERRDRLVVLHFDHRLRGRASTADARFCAGVARALGVEYVGGRWDDAPRGEKASEAQARAARQAFVEPELRRRRIQALWTGHQRNDVAETMLLRLARGSGTAGLAAPRPVQVLPRGRVNVRPLLTWTKTALEQQLLAVGVSWCEDESNGGRQHARNRLRADVLPAWCAAAEESRDVLAGVALARERLQEDDEALEAWLASLELIERDGGLKIGELGGRPIALWRRALHQWLDACGPVTDLSRAGFDLLLGTLQCQPHGCFSLGKNTFARWRRGRLWLEIRSGPSGAAR